MSPSQLSREEFTCAYQGYHGRLIVSFHNLAFNSEQLNVDFPWEYVKHIKVTTKHLKEVPTTMLEIKVSRNKQQPSQKPQIDGKQYFYGFEDIVVVEREIQKFRNAASTADHANDDSAPTGADNNANTTSAPMSNAKTNATGPRNGHQVGTSSFVQCDRATNGDAAAASPGSPMEDGDYVHGVSRSRQGAHTAREGEEDRRSNLFAPNATGNPLFLLTKSRPPDREHNSPGYGQQNQQLQPKHEKRQKCRAVSFLRRLLPLNSAYISDSGLQVIIGFLLVIVPVLFILVTTMEGRWESPSEGKLEKVIRDLESLQRWRKGQQQQKHGGTVSQTSEAPVHVTLSDLAEGVKELTRRFVDRQHELTALRLRHLQREVPNDVSPLTGMGGVTLSELNAAVDEGAKEEDVENGNGKTSTVETEQQRQQQTRRFSLARVKHDLYRVASLVQKILSFAHWIITGGGKVKQNSYDVPRATPWFFGILGGGGNAAHHHKKRKFVRYVERLPNGQSVTEYVDEEELEERRTCIRLTRSLVASADLLDGVLLQYMGVVMMPQYEAYLNLMQASTGVSFASSLDSNGASPSPSSSSRPSAGQGDTVGSEATGEQGPRLLKTIALRRHASLLLEMEPLSSWGHGYNSQGWKGQPDPSNHGSKNEGYEVPQSVAGNKSISKILNEFLLATQNKLLSGVDTSTPRLMFRNILKEVRYWSRHEEDWQTLVLWQLNRTNTNITNSNHTHERLEAETLKAMDDMPLFRGQWCFLEKPIASPLDSASGRRNTDRTEDHDTRSVESAPREAVYSSHNSKGKETQGEDGLACSAEAVASFPRGIHSSFLPNIKAVGCQRRGSGSVENPGEDLKYGSKGDALGREEETGESHPLDDAADDDRARLRNAEYISREVQLRWKNALELFFSAHNPEKDQWHERDAMQKWTSAGRGGTDSWWEREGVINDENTDGQDDGMSAEERDMVKIRRRLLQLFVYVGRRYDQYLFVPASSYPWSAAAFRKCTLEDFGCHFWLRSSLFSFFWPSLWFHTEWLSHPMHEWLRRIKGRDPVIRHLFRELLHIPLGEVEDVSWVLLNTMTTSQELLEVKHNICALMCRLVFVLTAVIVATVAFFRCSH